MNGSSLNGLCFGAIQLQEVLTHPSPYLLQAGAKAGSRGRGGTRGSYLKVELCVVSIAMEINSMPADDTTQGEHVNGEEGWTEYGGLGDPTGDSVGSGFYIPQSYILGSISEVGVKPFQGSTRETCVVLKSVQENVMVYSVKRSREVEKNEERCGTGIRSHQQVAGDSDKSCFCAVGGTKTRLKFLI